MERSKIQDESIRKILLSILNRSKILLQQMYNLETTSSDTVKFLFFLLWSSIIDLHHCGCDWLYLF